MSRDRYRGCDAVFLDVVDVKSSRDDAVAPAVVAEPATDAESAADADPIATELAEATAAEDVTDDSEVTDVPDDWNMINVPRPKPVR